MEAVKITYQIFVSVLGFLTGTGDKVAYVIPCPDEPLTFSVQAVGNIYASGGLGDELKRSPVPIVLEGKVRSVESPFGPVGVIDLSELTTPGLYRIFAGEANSLPFFIRNDLYIRHAYETFYYSHIQRCGCEVPGWHAACHLDDARRRDNGERVDTVGGWHDAGDLRKWMSATMWQAMGMLWVKRCWDVVWNQYADDDVLDELRWGNLYFHKMQDPDTGLVWNDVGGGVRGDNSDNHWTDNIPGTGDDRYLNTRHSPTIQFEYAWVQAMISAAFREADPEYSERCLRIARRALEAGIKEWMPDSMNTLTLSYAILAGCELFRSSGDASDRKWTVDRLEALLARQERGWIGEQEQYRGFFYDSADRSSIFRNVWESAVLPYALLAADEVLGGEAGERAAEAFRLYADEYLIPMSALSPFRVLPFGAFLKPRSHDLHRPLAGSLTYRFFHPRRVRLNDPDAEVGWWVGTTSHILGHAAALLAGARRYDRPEYRALALRQLEWVHGANPIGANIVSGRSLDNVWPHSRYVGIIPGAVMNGIGGTRDDFPVFGQQHLEWQTTEYWSPHQATYLMCLCEMHDQYDLSTDIGVRTAASP